MKALGSVPYSTRLDYYDHTQHYRTALLEAAEVIEGWLEGIEVNEPQGKRKVRVAPKETHLKNLALKLRETATITSWRK